MKKVERYESRDGVLWESEDKAEKHEAFLDEIDVIKQLLPPLPKDEGCHFANGHGYIQHTRESFNAYKVAILQLGGEICYAPMKEWANEPDSVANMGIAGRYFDDGNHHLYRLWHRVMCTDGNYREWGQPYFALNPDKGEMKKIA